eukprot:TRINITY_DN8123_c0_g1_i3.p1 TRINITY_DN8123_c0_g1~~TRINITY_DN8123_c0_g1_i3.p1  ORF type:complete len:286 (+),score=41.06 TRINITY_DN8123_c0_g1_i3:162-1019(+)
MASKPRRKRRGQVHGGWANAKPSSFVAKTDSISTGTPSVGAQQFNPAATAKQRQPTTSKRKQLLEQGAYELPATINSQPTWPAAELRLIENFVPSTADINWLEALVNGLSWDHPTITVKGREVTQPRLTAWYGNIAYSYSGLVLDPVPFPPLIARLASLVQSHTGIQFNTVLANYYRDGKDSVAWHADDEEVLGPHPPIASLSFGATRRFQLRVKPAAGETLPECTCSRSAECTCSAQPDYECQLQDGSLLLMLGAVQESWLHRVPKEYHDRGPRVNLTFRYVAQ